MQLRYPAVATRNGHYESVYCALVHPSEPRALWVRTTVKKLPGRHARGDLWVTWFDDGAVRAGKRSDLAIAETPHGLSCGPAEQGPAGSHGSIETDGLAATWDLAFSRRAEPLEHLSPALLYDAPLPRTKATSPVPELDVTGSLVVDGVDVDVTGWTGMLGHNWGTEHAARWVWLRVPGLGDDGTGWLDAVLGRVQVGPVLAPWTAFGALSLGGRRHHLGGLARRGTSVDLRGDGARLVLGGRGVTVEVDATIALDTSVGWEYSDPGGHRHEVVNCSVATMAVDVVRRGVRASFSPARRGVLEVGGDERAFDVVLQAAPD